MGVPSSPTVIDEAQFEMSLVAPGLSTLADMVQAVLAAIVPLTCTVSTEAAASAKVAAGVATVTGNAVVDNAPVRVMVIDGTVEPLWVESAAL